MHAGIENGNDTGESLNDLFSISFTGCEPDNVNYTYEIYCGYRDRFGNDLEIILDI